MQRDIYGLLVGISNPRGFTYAGERFNFVDLPQAADDVERLRSRFAALGELSGASVKLETLTGVQATRDSILGTLRQRLDRLEPQSTFVLAIEGHATEVIDLDGDEKRIGHTFDQIFPTADKPILDDDLWNVWQSRSDIVIFSVADTCRAETLTVRLTEDLDMYRRLGAILTRQKAPDAKTAGTIRVLVTETGPHHIQFAASARGIDAGDIQIGNVYSGKFTQAFLRASLEKSNLESYESWFRAAAAILEEIAPEQEPILYYQGPDPAKIRERPVFMRGLGTNTLN